MENLKTVLDNVRRIMALNPQTRNSDLALLIKFWQDVDRVELDLPIKVLQSMTKPETIIRCRRKIQHEGFLKPTDPFIIEIRNLREEVFRNAIKNL